MAAYGRFPRAVALIGGLCGLLLTLAPVSPAPAQPLSQSADEMPHVVFIEEPRELSMSSVTDSGPDGLTRLADLFRNQGALVEWIRLRDDINADVDVIVLVRPRRPLGAEDLARIWKQVGAGASLLVAIDPNGFQGGSTDSERGGLSTLTTLDQGITLREGILLEPWFTTESLASLNAALSAALPDPVPHPVTDPLRKYDLPLYLWGARPVWAEPFGPDSLGWSLVVADPWFAEANPRVYPSTRATPEPFALNIGVDRQGRLSVVAIGENTRTGARVALLGDAELVQNGFGLRTDGSGDVLAGNWLLAQRLTAWLMRREASLELPDDILWLAVDGESDDWDSVSGAGVVEDPTGDAFLSAFDLTSVRGLRTGSYAYLRIDTAMPTQRGAHLTLDYDPNRDGQAESTLVFDRTGVTISVGGGEPQPVDDAAFAAGSIIELRIPLRLVTPVTALGNLCLSLDDGAGATVEPDCLDAPLAIPLSAQSDAAPLRAASDVPLATVVSDGVNRANVRSGPGAGNDVVNTLALNSLVAVLGRSAASDWYYVQTAALEGWVNALALTFAGDPAQIPVREE